jgi:hypothetical protein
MDDFTLACVEAALWSSNDESDDTGGNPMDESFGIEDIAEEPLARLTADCQRFQASAAWLAVIEGEDPRTDRRASHGYSIEASAGHDFWLTRNGHGAGFWDGDWKEPHGTALDELAKSFGQVDLYVGDDGRLYCSA